MAPTCCKTFGAFFLMMMMALAGTEGARIPRASDHPKHKMDKGMVPLQLNPSTLPSVPPVRALHNSSISPWTYNTTHDPSLYPSYVSEARCLLKGCLDSEGREDLSLESKPILHEVMLLRRVRTPNTQGYHYKVEPRLLAVGCTCVQPVVQQQE
ncbi:hypothetical protein NQD34_001684 [Periophthalmus magnuspinnatus]|uniref:interleukin-17F-like n=1 Tax=Periophthalmus magnuspinnatus TaxID=409849 RepID=UPI00145BF836|nr:interleukin-17F-like [Periophthalmus magnuspinnatus]KAJ0001888.1 hypothetical protein NQD34_001684 [Periophthalmus magnuspinnatus]